MKTVLSLIAAIMIVSSTTHAAPRYRPVYLDCANPGSHQDVAKTPVITNNTGHDISASTKIYWAASDGDKGYVYGPLKINESKSGLGNAGNGYSCTAYYMVPIR